MELLSALWWRGPVRLGSQHPRGTEGLRARGRQDVAGRGPARRGPGRGGGGPAPPRFQIPGLEGRPTAQPVGFHRARCGDRSRMSTARQAAPTVFTIGHGARTVDFRKARRGSRHTALTSAGFRGYANNMETEEFRTSGRVDPCRGGVVDRRDVRRVAVVEVPPADAGRCSRGGEL